MKQFLKNPIFLILTTAVIVSAAAFSPVIFFGDKVKVFTTNGFYFQNTGKYINEPGVYNAIGNGHLEVDAVGWNAYDDASATVVDGTGGTSTTTCTQSNNSLAIASGSYGLAITKDAANRQGEGCSIDFTLKRVLRNSTSGIGVKFHAYTSGANYDAGDIVVSFIDLVGPSVTASVSLADDLIIDSADAAYTGHLATFTSTSTGNMRLAFHIASTETTAFTVYIDDVEIYELPTPNGPIVAGYYASTPNCLWDNTSSGSAQDFGTDADCPAPTVTQGSDDGFILAVDNNLPQISLTNLPPGFYKVTFQIGGVYTTLGTGKYHLRLTDGTTAGVAVGAVKVTGVGASTSQTQFPPIVYTFKTTVPISSKVIKLQEYDANGADHFTMDCDLGGGCLHFTVERGDL